MKKLLMITLCFFTHVSFSANSLFVTKSIQVARDESMRSLLEEEERLRITYEELVESIDEAIRGLNREEHDKKDRLALRFNGFSKKARDEMVNSKPKYGKNSKRKREIESIKK